LQRKISQTATKRWYWMWHNQTTLGLCSNWLTWLGLFRQPYIIKHTIIKPLVQFTLRRTAKKILHVPFSDTLWIVEYIYIKQTNNTISSAATCITAVIKIKLNLIKSFYSAPHCKLCTSYGNSVRLSVCLSHAGIVSKRLHVARGPYTAVYGPCQVVIPLAGGWPLPPEILAPSDLPLLKAASFDTFCLVAPQP